MLDYLHKDEMLIIGIAAVITAIVLTNPGIQSYLNGLGDTIPTATPDSIATATATATATTAKATAGENTRIIAGYV